MSNQLAISLRNVGAYYWRKASYFRHSRYWALHDVSFDLHHGESLGVIGRNGSGKSTLLQLLAGILRPDKGRLTNHGVKVSLLSLQIGFLNYLSGRQNAYLSGLLLGISKSLIDKRIDDIEEFSGLGDFFDQPIRSYSSGMRARLGFSIAFQLEPDVLLVDEVLGVGDEAFRAKSMKVMKDKIRSEKTVVLVSHNAETIRELCDKAIWIEDGISRYSGEVNTVLNQYHRALKQTA